jgi:hypothetical protein
MTSPGDVVAEGQMNNGVGLLGACPQQVDVLEIAAQDLGAGRSETNTRMMKPPEGRVAVCGCAGDMMSVTVISLSHLCQRLSCR